jgi:hypothetical protein
MKRVIFVQDLTNIIPTKLVFNWPSSSRTDIQNVKCIQQRTDNWSKMITIGHMTSSRSNVRKIFFFTNDGWDYYIHFVYVYSSPFLIKSNTICLTCNYYDQFSKSRPFIIYCQSFITNSSKEKSTLTKTSLT